MSRATPVRPTQPNVIILTSGLSGSSVLAGLLGRAGYWLGHDTKKIGYDTYENSALVDLNQRILRASGFLHEDAGDLPPPSIPAVESVAETEVLPDHRRFLEDCHAHGPWLWKDPRLCYTMYFWRRIEDFSSCRFLLATRDSRQAWTGLVLRGKLNMPWRKYLEIEGNDMAAASRFLREASIRALTVPFDDLIVDPASTVTAINGFLGTELTTADLQAVYRGKLGSRRWSHADFLKARLKVAIADRVLGRGLRFPQSDPGSG